MQHREPTPASHLFRALAVAGLLSAPWGCGNLTMGGVANATVVMSGDAPDATAALSPAMPSTAAQVAPSAPSRSSHSDGPEGQIELDFSLTLVSESGAYTRLGDERIEARLDVRGDSEVEPVNELIPVDRYVELRIVFSEIRIEISDGLIINGEPVVGEIRIEFDDVVLPVNKDIDVDVVPGQNVELLIDLNAPAWLEAVDPETLTVDPTVFAQLMAVTTR